MGGYHKHIARVVDGDKRAFAPLVALFGDMARAMATARLGDAGLAEDAVQEAFLTAFLHLPQLEDHRAFPGWFRTILLHHCARVRRLQARALPPGSVDPDTLPCENDTDPYLVCTRHLDQAVIRRILAGLPGVAREACVQRFVHGQPYEDIARTLGVPVGTIKRRLHAARDRIVKEFRAQRGKVMRLGYMPISDHLPAMVAHQHQGPEQQALVLTRFLAWPSLVRALACGRLDAAFVMAPLAMALFSGGLPIRYLLDGHHEGSAVTVRREAKGAGLPAGAVIALPHPLSTHRLLLHRLPGRDADDGASAPGPYLSPSYLAAALARRKIDGFLCSEPWNARAEAKGQGRILARSAELLPGHICCILVVREAFTREQPDLVHRILTGLIRAGAFITAHPGDAARIQAAYTGVDRALAEHVLCAPHISYTDLAPDKARAAQIMRMALETGLLQAPCDLDTFVDTGHL